jgi:hypothetical protein
MSSNRTLFTCTTTFVERIKAWYKQHWTDLSCLVQFLKESTWCPKQLGGHHALLVAVAVADAELLLLQSLRKLSNKCTDITSNKWMGTVKSKWGMVSSRSKIDQVCNKVKNSIDNSARPPVCGKSMAGFVFQGKTKEQLQSLELGDHVILPHEHFGV